MKKVCAALIIIFQAFIIGGVFATITFADPSGGSKLNSGRVFIKYENDLIVAEIYKAPLRYVIEEIEDKTGARLILKDLSIGNHSLSIEIGELTLEEALKRIFKNYNYVVCHERTFS